MGGSAVLSSTRAGLLVAAADHDHPAHELAVLDRPHERLARLVAHRRRGSDITGALAASAMRPVANMPPRKSLFGLGMPTNTKIARVPGSVVGLMRSMRPVNLRSPKPSTVRSTVMPGFSSGMSTAGTMACNSISLKSTTVTSGVSNATFSPGCTCRFATMPDSGAIADRILERVLREAHLRLGRHDAAARDVEARLRAVERRLRDEVLLEELLVGVERLLGERQLRLRRFELRPARSISFASRSAVSTRTSICPACTVSPSRTVISRTSPETLAFTVAWRTGCMVPETGSQRDSGVASTRPRGRPARTRA